ncbi:MAG: hypothetical protein EOO77_17910 [Oxalobacteraceae bacterium]|nr:MAG: hypothetical protein EOO77_17910 [Oxalobacteraceae bacterium]
MGGLIKVAVRFPDGEVITNLRHTNPLPYWIRHPKLIASDEAHLRTYANRNNSEEGIDSRLAPISYGLVVVDMMTKTVFTMNEYSNFGDIVLLSREGMEERFGLDEEPQGESFRTLLADGRLSIVVRPKTTNAPEQSIPLRCDPDRFDVTTKGFRDDDNSKLGNFYAKIGIDYAPWRIRDFGHDNPLAIRFALIEAGFTFSSEDETGWDEWSVRHNEDEDEEAAA